MVVARPLSLLTGTRSRTFLSTSAKGTFFSCTGSRRSLFSKSTESPRFAMTRQLLLEPRTRTNEPRATSSSGAPYS
jgi:hypothetical protein